MNLDEPNLERILRRAPAPQPPRQLKADLLAQVPSTPHPHRASAVDPGRFRRSGLAEWLRAWWPTAATACLAGAALAGVAYQQEQIAGLRHAVEALKPTAAPAVPPTPTAPTSVSPEPAADPRADLERLRKAVSELRPEIARLEGVAAENERLRQALARPAGLSATEVADLQAQQEKAWSIMCINHLKQLGLAARVWATDNGDVLPPDILSMTNEMATPKILVCPGEKSRQAATSWATYSAAHCSYEHLAPSGSDTEPQRVLFRCPVHGHLTLCDGSVQSRVAIDHPEWLVVRDGKLYLEQ